MVTLGVAPHRDLDTVISEQRSDCHGDVLHRCSGAMQNKQGSQHNSTGVRRVRKLVESSCLRVCC
jgi:hypothetical protein